MSELSGLLGGFREIAGDPKRQLDALLSEGRKVVGCLTCFCPEELVCAAGMTPFGIWGADMEATESRRWFPAFICSILHTTLEMGIKGALDGLTAIIVPKFCDSLKCMGANWESAVPGVPVINVAHAQNRKINAGIGFTSSQFREVSRELVRLGGENASDEDISDAIRLLNRRRKVMREFARLAAGRPEAVPPGARNDVIKSSYFMEAGVYTSKLTRLNGLLSALPEQEWDGVRVVTTGILADSRELLGILEDNGIAIAGDQVLHESVSFAEDVLETGDPIAGLAKRMAAIEGTSLLFDPGKQRVNQLLSIVRETSADGVIFVLTKFCDPEEYDFVPVKQLLDNNDVPCLLIEVDRQTSGNEQARTAIEAFAGILRSR